MPTTSINWRDSLYRRSDALSMFRARIGEGYRFASAFSSEGTLRVYSIDSVSSHFT
ncbi:MAG: hypothetical protein HOG19_09325 [Gammaproteobacteria bacterium]|nr:hypothetical protein [Gammaproteobacteria bacterium]